MVSNFAEQSLEDMWAVIAQYKDQEAPEYNNNPLIEALPSIMNGSGDIIRALFQSPYYTETEKEYRTDLKYHLVERLIHSYFYPQQRTIDLQRAVTVLIMQGYVGRNPLTPEYIRRSRQIHNALVAVQNKTLSKSDGKVDLAKYIKIPTTASTISIVGPSGTGKTTNLTKTLQLNDQVIYHPQHQFYQIVWLSVNCPHSGSLKGLCYAVFDAIDELIKTNYFEAYSKKNYNEDFLLVKLAQLLHTHHVGVLVIDEMQNLNNARRHKDDLLNFLVQMDNTIGVPVIRVGTGNVMALFQETFRNARRTGKFIEWDRMTEGSYQTKLDKNTGKEIAQEEWHRCIQNLWRFQWTKNSVSFSVEYAQTFYELTQGIYDVAIKLYILVQLYVFVLEESDEDAQISEDLIRNVAKEKLKVIQPMLDELKEGKPSGNYDDLGKINIELDCEKLKTEISKHLNQSLDEITEQEKNSQEDVRYRGYIVAKLLGLNLGISAELAAYCAEQVYTRQKAEENLQALVNEACQLALGGKPQSKKSQSSKPKDPKDEMGKIIAEAKKTEQSNYEALKAQGIVLNPQNVEDFFSSESPTTQ